MRVNSVDMVIYHQQKYFDSGFPRPAGEGQGEGNSVDMFIYHQQKYFDSGSPRPVGEGQGEGKWRRYENKSSVKLS